MSAIIVPCRTCGMGNNQAYPYCMWCGLPLRDGMSRIAKICPGGTAVHDSMWEYRLSLKIMSVKFPSFCNLCGREIIPREVPTAEGFNMTNCNDCGRLILEISPHCMWCGMYQVGEARFTRTCPGGEELHQATYLSRYILREKLGGLPPFCHECGRNIVPSDN